jgi:hypothetical protein
MKYFKPALLVRCRSLDDDVAEAAAAEWGMNIASYRERLQAIRHLLPRSVRGLLSRYSLHDARLLTVGFGKKQPIVTLQVRLEGSTAEPGPVLEMKYRVGPGGLSITRHEPFSSGPGLGWILYSEFDVAEGGSFVHSLLLSNGVELTIRFQSLRIQALEEVLVETLELPAEKMPWPLVGA